MNQAQNSHSTLPGTNNISKYRSTLITESFENVSAVNQCRICLQNQEESFPRRLIKPCKCSGSISYVHQDCIRKWLQATISKKTQRQRMQAYQRGVPCEMCKFMLKFQSRVSRTCCSWEQFLKLVNFKTVLFIMLIILIIISTGGMVLSIYYIAVNSQYLQQKGIHLMILILSLCGAIFSLLFLGVAIFLLIHQFIMKQRIQLGRIAQLTPKQQRFSRTKVVPIEEDGQNQTLQMISFVE